MKLGYIKDTPDERDQHIAKLGLSAEIPVAASLRQYVVDVCDQLETSSCCANAWAQALRIADVVAGAKEPALGSRLFYYFGARKADGGPVEDQGTQLRSVAKTVVKFGRPPESAWPFDPRYVNEQPPWEAFREAFDSAGPAQYHRLATLTEIKQAIAAGHAVVGGTSVGESIMSYQAGTIYSPDPLEPSIGGHALCVTGYDADSFEIVNSWNSSWGDRGFFRCSPAFMAGFTDLWCVSLQ